MVVFVRDHTVVSIKTSGTTNIGVNISTATTAGNLLVARILTDNAATVGKPVVSSIAKPAGETASWARIGGAWSTSGPTMGIYASGEMWAIKTTVSWPVASYTVTLDTVVTQKATQVQEFAGALATLRSTTGAAWSSGLYATTTGTAPVAGDLALGFAWLPNQTTPPAATSDSISGTWSTQVTIGSTGGSGATNNAAGAQYKIVTGTAHQTYSVNNSGITGRGVICAILQQDPSYVPVKIATSLVEGFDTEIPASWLATSFGSPSWEAGQAKMIEAVRGTYSGIQSPYTHDLNESSVFVKVTDPNPRMTNTEVSFTVWDAAQQNGLAMVAYTDVPPPATVVSAFLFRKRTAGTPTDVTPGVIFDQATMAYWRIRLTGGTAYFDTSPDATTWTNRYSTAYATSLSAVGVELAMGQWGTSPATLQGPGYFDNVNVVPSGGQALTYSKTDNMGVTDAQTDGITLNRSDNQGLTDSKTHVHTPGGVAPVASFTASVTTVVSGSTVTFTDTSTNTPTSWYWDFGSGASPANISGQGPHTVTFNTVGTSYVTMEATNASGVDEVDTPTAITVTSAGQVLTYGKTDNLGLTDRVGTASVFRGSTVLSSSATAGAWATTALAVDGVVGTVPDTYATWNTNVSGPEAYIEIGFPDLAWNPANPITSVTATFRHMVPNQARMSNFWWQAYHGGTPIGSETQTTFSSVIADREVVVPSGDPSVFDSTFSIRLRLVKGGTTQAITFSLDHIDLAISPPGTAAAGQALTLNKQDSAGLTDPFTYVFTPAGLAKAETLTDAFTGDLSKWPGTYGGVIIDGGRAKIPCTAAYPALWTAPTKYDMTGSSMFARIAPPAPGTNREFTMEVRLDNPNKALFLLVAGRLYFNTYLAGVGTTHGSVEYSPTLHQWWRLSSTGPNNIRYSTSPDGFTWFEHVSATTQFSLDSVELLFMAGVWGAGSPDDVAYVDNVNVPFRPEVVRSGRGASQTTFTIDVTDVRTIFMVHNQTSTTATTNNPGVTLVHTDTGGPRRNTIWAVAAGTTGNVTFTRSAATLWGYVAVDWPVQEGWVTYIGNNTTADMSGGTLTVSAPARTAVFWNTNASADWSLAAGYASLETITTQLSEPSWTLQVSDAEQPAGAYVTPTMSRGKEAAAKIEMISVATLVPPVRGTGLPVTAGLQSWYDADDASTFDFDSGVLVRRWLDKSGRGRHLQQLNNTFVPQRSGTQNGKATVVFDGYDDYMDTGPFTVAQPFTLIMALDTTGATLKGWWGSVGGDVQIYTANPMLDMYAATGNSIGLDVTTSHGGAHQWAFVFNGTTSSAYKDGALQAQGDAGVAGTLTGWRTAERNLFSGYRLDGQLFEVIAYSRVLTDPERQQVEAYLTAKWFTSGAQAFTRDVSDPIGITDAQTDDVALARSDSEAITDAQTDVITLGRSDPLALTESGFSPDKSSANAISPSDTQGLADSESSSSGLARSDNEAITDAQTDVIGADRSDNAVPTDSITFTRGYTYAKQDLLNLTDSQTDAISPDRSDTLALTDPFTYNYTPGVTGAPNLPGLIGWWDASTLGLADGAAINLWPDSSAGMRNLLKADTAPTFKTNILNGKGVARFSGISDWMQETTGRPFTSYKHFFVVAKYNTATFGDYDGLISGDQSLGIVGNAGNTFWYAFPFATVYHKNGIWDESLTGPMASWAYMSFATVIGFETYRLQIGLDRTFTPRYWDGDIAEIIAYDRVLSDSERLEVEAYLVAKWFPPQSLTGGGSDDAGLTDSFTGDKSSANALSTIDNLPLTDAQTAVVGVNRADTTNVTDAQTDVIGAVRSDTAALSDSITVARGLDRSDLQAITDAQTDVIGMERSDPLNLTETSNIDKTSAGAVNTVDNLGLADYQTDVIGTDRSDSAGPTDSLTTAIGRVQAYADLAALTDSITYALGRGYDVSDYLPVTDTKALTVQAVRADSLELTDSFTGYKTSAGAISPMDNMGLSDSWTVVATRALTADPIGVTDTASVSSNYAQARQDQINQTDYVASTPRPNRTDAVGLRDTATAVLVIGGRPYANVAGSFVKKPGKWWGGSVWVEKPWKRWDGSQWKRV